MAVLVSGGCAIRYHSAKTGTEHIWGFTHVKMRVIPTEGSYPPAVATQTESIGMGLGVGSESFVNFGWDRRTRILVPDDSSVSFEWPTTDLFDVRIGHRPPFLASPLNPTPSHTP